MMARMTRRALIAAGLLAGLSFPLTAYADVEWCFDDPPVLVRLPSGAPVNVNLWVAVPADNRPQLQATVVSGTADASGTTIQISVLVPSGATGPFPVQIRAAIAKDAAQTVQSGVSGTPVVMTLALSTD